MKRLPYKRKKRKKGPVQSKKVSYDGINFASGLERYMYMALKKAKIKSKYEGETFVLLDSFEFHNESYERQSNGKGEFKNRAKLIVCKVVSFAWCKAVGWASTVNHISPVYVESDVINTINTIEAGITAVPMWWLTYYHFQSLPSRISAFHAQ